MSLRNWISLLLATAALGVLASAATASPTATAALTGVWSGKTLQDLPPLGPDADFVEWKQHIVVRANEGRLTYLGVSVRYTCPDPTNPMAGDVMLNLGWKLGQGPKVTQSGGFSLNVTESRNVITGKVMRLYAPVSIRGVLGPKGASGRFDLAKGGCSGKGSWQAKRNF